MQVQDLMTRDVTMVSPIVDAKRRALDGRSGCRRPASRGE